jgi:hypothetical protein
VVNFEYKSITWLKTVVDTVSRVILFDRINKRNHTSPTVYFRTRFVQGRL